MNHEASFRGLLSQWLLLGIKHQFLSVRTKSHGQVDSFDVSRMGWKRPNIDYRDVADTCRDCTDMQLANGIPDDIYLTERDYYIIIQLVPNSHPEDLQGLGDCCSGCS